jgi:8-oxo-dGTP pyrophosphatase MutT (NUDIX family)
MNQEKLFNLLATAIILKEPYKKRTASKYLILQRSDHEKTFPGMWTVPGRKLSTKDYTDLPRETKHYWYNVIEKALKREKKEEANIDIKNIWYLTSLARVTNEGYGSLVLSFVADYADGEVKIEDDMQDFAWVTYEEAKKYDLIDGILDELWMTERTLESGKNVEWQRAA